MVKIWLDDVRTPPEGWTWAKNVAEATDLIWDASGSDTLIAEISFDNDLGEDLGEGHHLLDLIEELTLSGKSKMFFSTRMTVHSANPVARKRMETVISRIRMYVGQNRAV